MSQLVGILIAVQSPMDQKVKILTREYELSSVGFFYRGGVKDTMKFVARESLLGLPAGSRHSVQHEDKLCFIQMDSKEKIAAYVFCEKTYPKRIAFKFLNEVLLEFKNNVVGWPKYQTDENVSVPTIKKLFASYQVIIIKLIFFLKNPASIDNLTLAQTQVNEIEVILHENLAKLLERQGDLDQLILKSDDLSKSAKEFYTSSKKMNKKCCLIF